MSGADTAVAACRRAVRDSLRSALARGGLGPGDLVLAGVSGGPDSLALAAALGHVAPRLGLRAGAITVDHGLQPGSAERAVCVADTCKALHLDPANVARVLVRRHGGPEGAARTARYAALDAEADRAGAAVVLLGHTLDDQAETVLLRLARGSGARSLAGIPPANGFYLRPFLKLRRADTEQACAALGLEPWQDPHNADRVYSRARVRLDLLPALEEALGPGIAEALARSADLLRDDAHALDAWAMTARQAAVDDDGGLDIALLADLPAAVRRRVLRTAAVAAGARDGALSAKHVRALDALVTDWHGQRAVSLPGGLVGERRCDRLHFR